MTERCCLRAGSTKDRSQQALSRVVSIVIDSKNGGMLKRVALLDGKPSQDKLRLGVTSFKLAGECLSGGSWILRL